ncbi:hypothetical protein LPUS_05084 [Lasallia pustulata]|uniref:Proteophosphoglycan 5 n=1 Tax=Lasallia pustulata TaxID=136370 RepID=A0A1W5CXY1_9LECA|nr:hypothetical protein LPUS_05084 [Lasallia pustulata]
MPPGAGNTTKNPRGGRRRARNVTATPPSEGTSIQDSTNTTTNGKPEQTRKQPRRNLPRQASESAHGSDYDSAIPPMTPPRPLAQGENMRSKGTESGAESVSAIAANTAIAAETFEYAGISSPSTKPKVNRTPRPNPRTNSATPVRPGNTPVQAYAGPTFHASPAPSSLPMPKFFSKSVPDINRKNSLKAMMEEDQSEKSSEKSEESPTIMSAQRASERQVREESPLDIFFNADREEKNKRRQGSEYGIAADNFGSGRPAMNALQQGQRSPLRDHAYRHSCHPTDSSAGGLFAMEMDGAASPSNAYSQAFPTPYHYNEDITRPGSAPSHLMAATGHDEEQRKAKTLALKKLLLSPQPQRATTSPALFSAPNLGGETGASLSPSPSPRRPPPSRVTSGPFASGPANTPPSTGGQMFHHASFPFLQQSLAATANGSPRPRPPSSNLRQEVTPSTTPIRAELPALPSTPTPSRVSNPYEATSAAQNNHNVHLNGNTNARASTYASAQPYSDGSTFPTREVSSVKTMEDDLRRILKLEILGSDGASGVRS